MKTNCHLHSQYRIYVLISLFNLTSFCSNVIVMFSVCDGNLSHCQPCNYTGYVSALQKGRDIFMELKDGNDYKGSHHFLPSYHRPVLSQLSFNHNYCSLKKIAFYISLQFETVAFSDVTPCPCISYLICLWTNKLVVKTYTCMSIHYKVDSKNATSIL